MLDEIIKIAVKAGDAVSEVALTDSIIGSKEDLSPVTRADFISNEIISKDLNRLHIQAPILSEEGKEISYSERKSWSSFWCVDPLDGTKEFIKKTGDFTVNIALIEQNFPVLGVVYAPVRKWIYFAEKGNGSWFHDMNKGADPKRIQVRPLQKSAVSVVASKDHAGPGVQKMLKSLPNYELKSMGSSLKFCMIASGEADVYYRDVPTYEWDTAAAQIIVEEAGGQIVTPTGERLSYNKEVLLNPSLLTFGNDKDFWMGKV